MKKSPNSKIATGTSVVVPQDGREAAGIVHGQHGWVTFVRLTEGRNAGKTLEFYTSMVRIPAAFEVVA